MEKKVNDGAVLKILKLGSAIKKDGWRNVLTGLGVAGKDKRLGAEVQYAPLKESELEDLYAADDAAAKTVDFIPGEGTREWIEYQLPEEEGGKQKIKEIEKFNEDLEVQQKFNIAWTWARLYGGAGLFVAVDDGVDDLREPLVLEKIRSIKSLTPLNRFELQPQIINGDITSKNFFMPDFYQVTPRVASVGSLTIHHTRIIRFNGSRLPRRQFSQNNYWDDSVLTRLFNVLRNYNLSNDSVASVLQEFKVGILKLRGLADLIAQDEEDVLKKRIELMNLSKSVLNTVVLDAEDESFENLSIQLSGLAELLGKVGDRMVAATGLPHTIILGEGASGFLSGAGNAEKEQLSDFIKVHQVIGIKRPLDEWNVIMQMTRQGPTSGKILPGLGYEFKPLWQMDEKEQSELMNKQAQTDQIYFGIGALDSDEIRQSRFGGDDFSLETSIQSEDDADLEIPGGEENENFNSDQFDPNGPHSHFDFPQKSFTGSATDGNNADPNHTHTRTNGKQTGPGVYLPNGQHVHAIGKEETFEAVSLESVKRMDWVKKVTTKTKKS